MPSTTGIAAVGVVVIVVVCATVAVCLGHMQEDVYGGLLLAAIGGGIGAGAHASGVARSK